jgi:hypothetical protein
MFMAHNAGAYKDSATSRSKEGGIDVAVYCVAASSAGALGSVRDAPIALRFTGRLPNDGRLVEEVEGRDKHLGSEVSNTR